MHDTLLHLVATYGYAVVALAVLAEGFGIPVPGETVLVTAAALAGRGQLSLAGVVTAAAVGTVLGGTGGYWIGCAGGLALLRRHGRWLGVDENRIARAHGFFERHGGKTVFLGRFVALLRILASVLAGAARMPFARFSVYNALGGIAWALAFGALGYAFGENLPRLERYAGQAGLALALLVALVVALVLAGRWFRDHRAELAESATAAWKRVASDPRLATFRQRHAKLWTFVAARFEAEEYLGLHLTIGLALSLAALWAFAGITEDVIHGDPLTLFDLRIADWFVMRATPGGQAVAVAVSLVGSPLSMAALAVAVALVLALRHRWVLVTGWVAAFAGGGVLDWALKVAIHRPRPPGAEAFLHGESFSFPSGHSMGSLIGFGMLAYLLVAFVARRWRAKLAIGIAAALLVLAIGLSRLYLGVHYFSDVIGGFAAGAVWLSACVSGCEVALRQRGLAPWEVGLERRRTPRTAAGPPAA